VRDLKHAGGGFAKAVRGARYAKADYIELLSLLFFLVRLTHSKGAMALEPHIENPRESTAFAAFPKIRDNPRACAMICDYLRMVGMNVDDPYQMDEVMGRELKKHIREDMHFPHALQSVSDALPALGIVAAVLGVIKTMASIDKPPIVLGEMIAGALVGTFLGVLLAYGIVAPIAARLGTIVQEEASYFDLVRSVLVAHLQGNPPQISVEIGRKEIPVGFMPNFQEVESAMATLSIG
jgi:chemotaxis protein MotA